MSIVFKEAERTTSWQVPKFETPPSDRSGWVEDMVREGEGYISGTAAYRNLGRNMALFDGIFNDRTRSTLCSNFLKYNIRKFVETLADVREIGVFGSDAVQFKPYAEIETRVAKCIYLESQYPRQLRKALQYAATMGVGYLWQKCKAEDYGFGERRIVFEPLGLLDVLPVQVPASNDVQDAYVNTIYEYMPIAEAHARFPLFQANLHPVDRMLQPTRLAARRLDWAEKFRYGDQTRNWGNLYCEIRYTYVRDLRINNTGYELPMGDEGTSWYYLVPSLGQPILGGIRNGQPFMREAQAKDCRVYPHLRLIITTPGMTQPMYDGPAFDWHGQMPAVQYTVDDWPWEACGLSLVQSVGSIESTKRKHERMMDQVITTRLDPPMGYDRTGTAGPKIENFDLFERNVRMGVDGKPQDTFQSILPESVVVNEVNFKFHEILSSMEEQQLGINDIGNLMNIRANLSGDSFDKALETIGPIAKGIAASMEAGNSKIGYMLKFNIPQWMDARRIIEYVGTDNITPEIFDYDPASMIPSHMPDEYVNGFMPHAVVEGKDIITPSQYDLLARARNFAASIRLVSVPSTLLKITQAQEQTKYMLIYSRGFPISPHTVAKKIGIENYGEIPGDTEFAKWVNWKKEQLALAAEGQELAAQLGLLQGGEGIDAESAASSAGSKQHAGGRPSSYAKPGKLQIKDKNSNPRPIISTSG